MRLEIVEDFVEYRYGHHVNYEDFASGRVLYGQKGAANFPVRLAQEIFGRCLAHSGLKRPVCLYDCCCGGGYLLTVLGFLNQDSLGEIMGSDVAAGAVELAGRNLALLSPEGLDTRIAELQHLVQLYGKPSHQAALDSARKLKGMIRNTNMRISTFTADVFQLPVPGRMPDILITDVPYGGLVSWQRATGTGMPGTGASDIDVLLDALGAVCDEHTIIAICMDKAQKITNSRFQRLERQNIGKRRFEIFRKCL